MRLGGADRVRLHVRGPEAIGRRGPRFRDDSRRRGWWRRSVDDDAERAEVRVELRVVRDDARDGDNRENERPYQ